MAPKCIATDAIYTAGDHTIKGIVARYKELPGHC
jgi:hypothetical protein